MDYSKFVSIIKDGLKLGDNHDKIKADLCTAGLPFSEVNQFFTQVGIESGCLLSMSNKRKRVESLLKKDIDKIKDYSDYKNLQLHIELLCDYDIRNIMASEYKRLTGRDVPRRINNVFVGDYKNLTEWYTKNLACSDEEIREAAGRITGKREQGNMLIKFRNYFKSIQ